MPYRVEESKNGRAGCKNNECKTAGVKIQKGELRFATQVTIQDHTSWAYKHWGCVTPAQIANLVEDSGGDTDMVDGYDELPAELQEKVDFALEHGHVPDEDWKGDVECNRPGQKGFRVKASKKKGKQDDEDDEVAKVPKPKTKRGRAIKDEEDEDEASAPKKPRGKGNKAAPGASKASKENADGIKDEQGNADGAPAPKKARGKGNKAAPKATKDDVDGDKDGEDDAPEEPKTTKSKRGRKAVAETDAAPPKRSGRKRAAVNYEEE